ncbi:MAG TPA: HD domain-containing protein, partial [Gemmatimonadaceae bacterium]|nr:HD domain-containing protein [Gemmatimonadaceae bacterium]
MRDSPMPWSGGFTALTLPIAVIGLLVLASASVAASRDGSGILGDTIRERPARVVIDSSSASWRDSVRAFAEAHLQHTAWGPAHARRDYEMTLTLARAEGITVDDDALYAAAYLHDMGGLPPYAKQGVDHGDRSAQLVDSVLRGTGFPMEKIELVKEIVDHHQYYRPPDTLAVAILFRDADILDFLGAIDIARIISLTTRERIAPDLPSAIEVIRKQMTDMPARLQTEAAKREGERRVEEMRRFLDALARETTGSGL